MVEDPQMWYRTIMDAFREMPTMRQRYTWLAILFANAGIQDIVNVFNKIVRDDQDHNLLPRNMDNASFEQQRQHILRRIDTLLRTMGSSCAQIGLDDPEGLEFTDRDLMNVISNTIYLTVIYIRPNSILATFSNAIWKYLKMKGATIAQ